MIYSVFPAVAMIILTGISVRDIRTRTIPDRYGLCLLIWVLAGHLAAAVWPVSLRDGVAAALIICLIILAADLLYLGLRGMPVMGGGDLKLLCIGALALGLRLTAIAVAFAVSLAAVSVIVGVLARYIRTTLPQNRGNKREQRALLHLHSRIPLAPFLTAGFIFAFQAL